MSTHRDKERDKAATRELILNRDRPAYRGGKNWLGHGVRDGKSAVIDDLLLDGATMERLLQERGAIHEHFWHLTKHHDLPVTRDENDLYKFDREHLGIEGTVQSTFGTRAGVDANGLTAKDRVYQAFLANHGVTAQEAHVYAPERSIRSVQKWLWGARLLWETGLLRNESGSNVPSATQKMWIEALQQRDENRQTADSDSRQVAAKDRAATQLQQEGYYEPKSAQDARKRVLREIAQREGQPGFRRSLIRAYNGQCAVSGCDAVDALEACHIAPYRESQSNRVSNGLLLRADIHTLLDLDLIGIDPDSLRVILSDRLRMTSYREFDGSRLLVPNDPRLHPDEAALRARWKQFLRNTGAKPLPPRGSVEAVMSSFGAWKMSRKERDRIQRIIEQDR